MGRRQRPKEEPQRGEGELREPAYRCTDCGVVKASRYALKQHRKRAHNA